MITLITGPANSGKSTKAKEITKNKNTEWFTGRKLNHTYAFSQVDDNTEYLVIDEANNIDQLKCFFKDDKLLINRKMKKPIHIKLLNIIIISQTIKADHILNLISKGSINVIPMGTNEPGTIDDLPF